MRTFLQDLRHGARSWAKSPGFTLVAAGTLALGIGANTAIFSVVNGILLRPFPFSEPDRLVVVWERNLGRGFPYMNVSPPNFADWKVRSESLQSMAAFTTRDVTLLAETPERVRAGQVSATLFPLLGVSPLAGRFFLPEEDRPGGRRVAIVSHGFWQRRFGGRSGVSGRELPLDGEPHTVVGIMPPGFSFPPPISLEGNLPSQEVEIWTPLAIDYAGGQRSAHYLLVVGRLAEGARVETARTEMRSIAAALEDAYPASNQGWDARIEPLAEQVTGNVRPALLVLLAAVALVLVIACANVANLLLTRGVGRQREMAIRASLGAGKARLVRQLLTETLLLVIAGGLAGLGLAMGGVKLLVSLGPSNLPRLSEVTFDGRVLGFTALLCVLAGLLFGLAPALHVTAARLSEWLSDRDPRGGGSKAQALRNLLVISQVALALMLLAGAVLLARSFLNLRSVDPGFAADNVVTLSTTLPRADYGEAPARIRFLEEVLEGLEGLPGVTAVGAINEMPLAHDRQGTSFQVEGEPAPPPGQEPQTNVAVVSRDYFQAMGIPLLRGRSLDARDREQNPDVILINNAFAERYFPDRDPLGARIFLGMSSQTPREIVGVVGDVRHRALGEEAVPNAYAPYLQYPRSLALSFVLRTASEPSAATRSVREVLHSVDATLPLFDVRTAREVVDGSMSRPRFATLLIGLFAASALLLAAVGLYGVMTYSVSQRIPEMGLRMALGAQSPDIMKLVVGRGVRLASAGVGLGLLGSLLLTRFLSSLLFGVSPTDLSTLTLVPVGLFAVALAASYLPARRATRVAPIEALRYE